MGIVRFGLFTFMMLSTTNEDWHNDDTSLRGDNCAEHEEKATWNGTTYDYSPKEP